MLLYLASNSPRRHQLIKMVGWDYQVISVAVDESPLVGEESLDHVTRLAQAKAMAASQLHSEGVVVSADTIVVQQETDGEKILGKPKGRWEAEEMLRFLRGRTHQVITALCLIDLPHNKMLDDYCVTDVPMRDYTDKEMMDYIDTGDPFDKAGAYAIQHAGFHPVETLRGCFANVMGLPLCHLQRNFVKLHLPSMIDLKFLCYKEFDYQCTISKLIQDWKA